jgi:histidyl-tRNA synthetase
MWRGGAFIRCGYDEVVVPSIWAQETFARREGPAVLDRMYAFDDPGGRAICLIPEVTALLVQRWEAEGGKVPAKVFYVARCYRYEQPASGRFREFTQVGVEWLGGDAECAGLEVRSVLEAVLEELGIRYQLVQEPRGLRSYSGVGFVARCGESQIAGGGPYEAGVGWAMGAERVLDVLRRQGGR